jgi:hypothetical protein
MISKDRVKADILDRTLQRMLEGNAAVADSTRGDERAVSEIRPLLETAGRARELLPTHGPSPEFIAATEARLLRRIKAYDPRSARRESRMAGLARWSLPQSAVFTAAITLVVIIASGLGASSASAQALPGDVLYPVKQGLEEISLTFSMSTAGEAALLADFADERLQEIEQLVAKHREADLIAGFEYYGTTLSRLDAAVEQLPSDSTQLDGIRARLARHTQALWALRDRLPEQAQSALERAIDHSQKSRDRVEALIQNRGSEGAPPDQEKESTKDTGKSNDASSPTEKKPDTGANTGTPELTETPEPINTLEPTNTPVSSETPKPSKTLKPSKTPKPIEPTKIPKPSKEKTKKK